MTTAVIEAGAGVALLTWPAGVVPFLVGGTFDTPTAHTVGRIAGAALLALGVACWMAREDGPSRAAFGLIAAMGLYNTLVATFLVWAGVGLGMEGILLWPAVVLHAVMSGWGLFVAVSIPGSARLAPQKESRGLNP